MNVCIKFQTNLLECVVVGHESSDHLRQRYRNRVQSVGESCQELLGLLEPLLSPSKVGQAQEVGC